MTMQHYQSKRGPSFLVPQYTNLYTHLDNGQQTRLELQNTPAFTIWIQALC